MKDNTLLSLIGIDRYDEFEYFEDLALLLEAEDEISADEIYALVKSCNLKNLAELFKNYFEDITEHIPGESIDLYTLLSNIGNSLVGMCLNCNEDGTYLLLADEIFKFREWYLDYNKAYCIRNNGADKDLICLRDALVNARLEALGGEKCEYYFDKFLKYPLEDYVISFKDLINIEQDDEEGYVIDDEFKDEDYV
mgnify:CR=1 FL=1